MVTGLGKVMGDQLAAATLSQELFRNSFLHIMTVGFYLLKFIQTKNLKIFTIEEPLTDEDIERYDRISRASDVTSLAAMMGYTPEQAVKEMIKTGKLKEEDLEKMGFQNIDLSDIEKPESN